MTNKYVHPWYNWVNHGTTSSQEYSVVFVLPTERIVDSRNSSLADADHRRMHCENLLHKLNVAEDTKVLVEQDK